MTNQVAITMLKNLEQSLDDYCELNDEGKEAFHMAITALELFGNSEQLPSTHSKLEKNSQKLDNENGELISRQAAIDAALTFFVEFLGGAFHEDDQRKLIALYEQLPSVQPQPQWILVSERLPEDESLVLVYYILNQPIEETRDIWIGWHEMDNVWYVDGEEHGEEWNNEVLAWMPLPEPWKGGEE